MQSKFLKLAVGAICLGGMLGLPIQTAAIQISYEARGIGSWDPASVLNNDADALLGVYLLTRIWNGPNVPGVYNYNDKAVTFYKGTAPVPPMPQTLTEPRSFGAKRDSNLNDWPGLDNTLGEFDYMLGKYGQASYVFYIGDLLVKDITLPLNLGGKDLSHASWFRATGDITVPDGGATGLLLGAALAGFAVLRRKLT